MASDITPPVDNKGKPREKVVLKPGFHLTDWIRITQSGKDMSGRNGKPLRNISRTELSQHNTEDDCWVALNGKVYNVTAYLNFHPGGVQKLMMGAGKDCTALFNHYHRWVNANGMIGSCLVGNLSGIDDMEALEEEEDVSDV